MELSLPESGGGNGAFPPPAPLPAPMLSANAPPPFLVKTYEMVDDPSTNDIVSWSSTNNSFVVWDPPEFGRSLLPKYFKHNNFSSFVRQLNTYGFRKVDPDRWEFANEGFLRGQKHLLKTISRRRPAQVQVQVQQPQQVHGQSTSARACLELGKFGLEEEVERLKRDKNVLMQELVHLRQQQQATDSQMQTMFQRMQGMEQRQQQMMSFLAKAVNSPGFLAQFVQQQNDSNLRITEGSKKRRLKTDDQAIVTDGQIIKYQPLINEAAKNMLKQLMKFEPSPRLDNIIDGDGSFSIRDVVSTSKEMGGGPAIHVSGATLQEVPPCSLPSASAIPAQSTSNSIADIQSHLFDSPCEIAGGSQSSPPVDYRSQPNMMMPQVCPLPEISPEVDDMLHTEPKNDGFLDPTSLAMNGGELQLDGGDFDADTEIDWNTTLRDWEKLLESPSLSVESSEELSSNIDDFSSRMEMTEQSNGWGDNASQHLQQLTEQMGNLSSQPENV